MKYFTNHTLISLFSVSNLSSVRGFVQIPCFEDDPSLCPVRTIKEYLNKVSFPPWFKQTNKPMYDIVFTCNIQVSPLRGESDALFLSVVPPHLPVTASTLARWLTSYLTMAGIDTSVFKQHSARAATAAYLRTEKSFSVQQICSIACWSSVSGVFEKFYSRYF